MKFRHLVLAAIFYLGMGLILSGCSGSSSGTTSSNLSSLDLSVSQSSISLGGSVTLSASGGTSPYTYSLYSGAGTVSNNTFIASSSVSGSNSIKAEDTAGNAAYVTITVGSTVTLSLSTSNLAVGASETLSATGGTAPYTYSLYSGSGSVSGNVYTASASGSGTAVIKVMDSAGNTAYATISTGSASSLVLSLSALTVTLSGTVTLSASGGTAPYTYSLYSGTGTVSGSIFTASASQSGVSTVMVTDAAGDVAYSSIAVGSSLILNLSATSIATGGTVTLSASGGTAPYTYTLVSGSGTVSGNIYTAPAFATTAEVEVTDESGSVAYSSIVVTYYSAIQISPATSDLYTGETVSFSATGGAGGYNFALVSGGGTLSGPLYTAPSTATTAQVEVWDSSGNSAVSTITVTVKDPLYSAQSFTLSSEALLTYSMPSTTTDLPAFVIGGAGTTGTFGQSVAKSTSATAFEAAPSSAAVVLTNYNSSDSSPYVGTLVIAGTGGTQIFSFCVQQGDQVAHLQAVQTALTMTTSFQAITYPSLASQVAAGTNLEGLWIEDLNSGKTAASASLQVQSGSNDHQLTSCAAYTSYSLLSAASAP